MKALVLLSGGYDSAAVLSLAAKSGAEEIHALFVNYGQNYAEQEEKAANYAWSAVRVGNAKKMLWMNYASIRVPLEFIELSDYIPYRNLVLTSIALNYAQARGLDVVMVGSKTIDVREEDPWSFKDSCKSFYDTMGKLAESITEKNMKTPRILMPIVGWTKKHVMEECRKAGMDLTRLWSCYSPLPNGVRCGACHACVVAEEAMKSD